MEAIGERGHLHQPEHNVKAKHHKDIRNSQHNCWPTAPLRRPGEPQCHTNQAARRGGQRHSIGKPSALTAINGACHPSSAKATSTRNRTASATRNGVRKRCGRCGNNELATDMLARGRPVRPRSQHAALIPAVSRQVCAAGSAERARGDVRVADGAAHRRHPVVRRGRRGRPRATSFWLFKRSRTR